ncbi:MAG: DUF3368 domain-containing protein [Chloroflexi bacterium]|nr:DUF3368 domain-containing protein [Chloroflexota bacterium]
MSRLVVCDTGPLLHLSEAGAIHLLRLAGEVLIPPLVAEEFMAASSKQKIPKWVAIHQLDQSLRERVSQWIDGREVNPGEAQAIGLALHLKSDWLLTDDALVRKFAETLGLEVHGSLGLLLWAVAAKHIGGREARQFLNGLNRSSLWISKRVMNEALGTIEELSQK